MDVPALAIAEILLAGAVLVVVVAILLVYLRRRVISHGSDVVLCGFRPGRSGRWRPSLLRMSATTLEVFPLFGWSVRPSFWWTRRSVDLGEITTLEEGALPVTLDAPGRARRVAATALTGAGAAMSFELALGPLPYTALRYWVESAPPTPTWAV